MHPFPKKYLVLENKESDKVDHEHRLEEDQEADKLDQKHGYCHLLKNPLSRRNAGIKLN